MQRAPGARGGADAELREATNSRQLAALEHRRSTEVLRLRSLRSPVSGVVVDRYMNPGEISEVGAKPILKLADIDTLHVEVILPTSAFGARCRVEFPKVRAAGGRAVAPAARPAQRKLATP